MIDEAHERSLNTDLVIAISKLVLSDLPKNFHVVVASATINPTPCLRYYFGSERFLEHPALNVPGKLHPVTIEELPCNPDEVAGNAFTSHFIKILRKTLIKYSSSHCLVFLSGSEEIEGQAKRLDSGSTLRQSSSRSSKLSAQLQRRRWPVRMICFCTNVAETVSNLQHVSLRRRASIRNAA